MDDDDDEFGLNLALFKYFTRVNIQSRTVNMIWIHVSSDIPGQKILDS